MLLDANVLIYAVSDGSPHHSRAYTWVMDALNGNQRLALPWQTIGAFLRIATNPRLPQAPLSGVQGWAYVNEWLALPNVWVPPCSQRTALILGELIVRYDLSGLAIPDAQLAALAIEHGLSVVSTDTDFARFDELRWINPLR